MKKSQNGFALLEIVIITLIIIVIGLVGFMVFSRMSASHSRDSIRTNIKREYSNVVWPDYIHMQSYMEQGQVQKEVFNFFGKEGQDYELYATGTYSKFNDTDKLSALTDNLISSLSSQGFKSRLRTELPGGQKEVVFYKKDTENHVFAGRVLIGGENKTQSQTLIITFSEYDKLFANPNYAFVGNI